MKRLAFLSFLATGVTLGMTSKEVGELPKLVTIGDYDEDRKIEMYGAGAFVDSDSGPEIQLAVVTIYDNKFIMNYAYPQDGKVYLSVFNPDNKQEKYVTFELEGKEKNFYYEIFGRLSKYVQNSIDD